MQVFGRNYNLWDLQQKDLMINVNNLGKDPSQMRGMNSIYLSTLCMDNDRHQRKTKTSLVLDKTVMTKKLVFKNLNNSQSQLF